MRHLNLPPVWQLGVMALMWLLDRLLPLGHIVPDGWRGLGPWLMLTGFILAGAAVLQMIRRKASPHPHHAPENLVVDGLFALSRNPIYLGMLILVAGFALWLGSLSPWVGPPLYAFIVTRRFILEEEARLEAHFADAFATYRKRVRRWL